MKIKYHESASSGGSPSFELSPTTGKRTSEARLLETSFLSNQNPMGTPSTLRKVSKALRFSDSKEILSRELSFGHLSTIARPFSDINLFTASYRKEDSGSNVVYPYPEVTSFVDSLTNKKPPLRIRRNVFRLTQELPADVIKLCKQASPEIRSRLTTIKNKKSPALNTEKAILSRAQTALSEVIQSPKAITLDNMECMVKNFTKTSEIAQKHSSLFLNRVGFVLAIVGLALVSLPFIAPVSTGVAAGIVMSGIFSSGAALKSFDKAKEKQGVAVILFKLAMRLQAIVENAKRNSPLEEEASELSEQTDSSYASPSFYREEFSPNF